MSSLSSAVAKDLQPARYVRPCRRSDILRRKTCNELTERTNLQQAKDI